MTELIRKMGLNKTFWNDEFIVMRKAVTALYLESSLGYDDVCVVILVNVVDFLKFFCQEKFEIRSHPKWVA